MTVGQRSLNVMSHPNWFFRRGGIAKINLLKTVDKSQITSLLWPG
uniref:Uncharacterized protein n=1 Tax=Pelinobius muticus TaxID=753628 RepID=D5J704_PELMU|nr:hypothetical protein [Pelinobius muticus]